VTTVRPRPVAHGVYEGPVRLWSATTWRVWLHLNTAADPAARFFSAGAVQTVDR
jgi:hypothetical protein